MRERSEIAPREEGREGGSVRERERYPDWGRFSVGSGRVLV